MKRRVLVYVHYPSHVRVMTRVAAVLQATGRFEPIVYFDSGAVAERFARECVDQGFESDPAPAEATAESDEVRALTGPVGPWVWRQLLAAVRKLPPDLRTAAGDTYFTVTAPGSFSLKMARHLRGLRRAERLLERHRVDAVVLPGDSVSYESPWLVRAAHRRGAPAIVVPFTVSGPTELAVDLAKHREFMTVRRWNRILAERRPRWRYQHDGKELVRLPAPEAVVFELLGLAPDDPWTLHSGFTDRIAVESEYMLDHYRRHGFPERQLSMVGAITDDLAARARQGGQAYRDQLADEVGLPRGRRLAVFTMSEFTAFFVKARAEGFSSRDELVQFWLDTFAEMTGWNVLISLHPFIRPETYPSLDRPNVRVSRRPIEELIGASDLFISSISATVRTAIACGVPVVDHDPFAFRYPNFVGMPGVFIVEGRAPFRDALLGLALDQTRYDEAAKAQRQIAPRFGQLDGKVAVRLVELFDQLIGERRAA